MLETIAIKETKRLATETGVAHSLCTYRGQTVIVVGRVVDRPCVTYDPKRNQYYDHTGALLDIGPAEVLSL